ncbi:MAG: hypothetical protein V3W04_15675 [Gammaproteobacteria bacterium]
MNPQKGITLLEVLLAISLISSGYMAIAKLQITLWQNTRLTTERNQAMSLATEKMEELDFSLPTNQQIATGNDTTTINTTDYTRRWSVQQSNGITNLSVNILWGQGKTSLSSARQPSGYTSGAWGIHHNEQPEN